MYFSRWRVFFFDLTGFRGYYRAPMTVGLPKRIDVKRLALSGRVLEGNIDYQPAGRLASLILACEGDIAASLHFTRRGTGEPQISGQVQATVSMTCQRCLKPVSIDLQCRLALTLVASEAAALQLPDTVDSLLSPDDYVDLPELIEDELILALPIVPRHADCKMPVQPEHQIAPQAGRQDEEKRSNPFAVLKDLK